MKHLLNTLYILSEDIYLSLDGENVVANRDKQVVARYPLHTLQDIITFSYAGASPALMGVCAQRQIGLSFCTPRGKFLARVCGEGNGNVLLRRTQYRTGDDPTQCCQISRTMIFGKLFNARWSIERTRRDHGLRVDGEKLVSASKQIYGLLSQVKEVSAPEELRGLEGVGASAYFSVFDEMILPGAQPSPSAGRRQRHALLRLQPAGPRLRLRLGECGAGFLCGIPAPGPPGSDFLGPGPDGGTASLHGGPLCAHAHQQPPGQGGRLSIYGERRCWPTAAGKHF